MKLHIYHGQGSSLTVTTLSSYRINTSKQLQGVSGTSLYYVNKTTTERYVKIVADRDDLVFFTSTQISRGASCTQVGTSYYEKKTENGITTYTVRQPANTYLFITYGISGSGWYGVNPSSVAVADWWLNPYHNRSGSAWSNELSLRAYNGTNWVTTDF